MRTTMLIMCALMTLAGCSAPRAPETSFNIVSLTPYHCENGHKPIHCGSGNLSAETDAASVYANFSVNGGALPNPYPLRGEARLTATLAYAGAAGSGALDITIATEDVAGVKWTSPTNVTKTVEPGESEEVVFTMEPTAGWPDGDWIFPRFVLGIGDDRWVEHNLIFVMAQGSE